MDRHKPFYDSAPGPNGPRKVGSLRSVRQSVASPDGASSVARSAGCLDHWRVAWTTGGLLGPRRSSLRARLLHRITVSVNHLNLAEIELANTLLNLFAISDDHPDQAVRLHHGDRRRIQV
jgi:hypothetical protein